MLANAITPKPANWRARVAQVVAQAALTVVGAGMSGTVPAESPPEPLLRRVAGPVCPPLEAIAAAPAQLLALAGEAADPERFERITQELRRFFGSGVEIGLAKGKVTVEGNGVWRSADRLINVLNACEAPNFGDDRDAIAHALQQLGVRFFGGNFQRGNLLFPRQEAVWFVLRKDETPPLPTE